MLTLLLCFNVVLLFGILYTLERMRKSLVGDAEVENTPPMSIKGLLFRLCLAAARKEMRETGKDSDVFWNLGAEP